MSRHVAFVAALAVLVTAAPGAGAETLESLTVLWRAKDFATVLPKLHEFRLREGGRCWQVDYMIGTSECHGGDLQRGIAALEYARSRYRMPAEASAMLERAIGACRERAAAPQAQPALMLVPISGQRATRALVAGKGGYAVAKTAAVANRVEVVPVPIADLEKRVLPVERAGDALRAAGERLGHSTHAGTVDEGFAIACGTRCEFPPEVVGECLDRHRRALRERFGMEAPRSTITVYLAHSLREVVDYAGALHGVELPLGTVAYSVNEDASIVGMVSAETCGSLAHELVHLAIRRNFGDSPPWLEEGLASEVAVADVRPRNELVFRPSWRDDTLREHWALRPTVGELLGADWARYATDDVQEADRVAAIQAMAAVFVRYLDAKGILTATYRTIQGRDLDAAASDRTAVAAVERALGKPLDQIDADFVAWFRPDAGKDRPKPKPRREPVAKN